MLQYHATLKDARNYLKEEVSKTYPEGETQSMIRLILEHCGFSPQTILLEPHMSLTPEIVAQINEIGAEIHTQRPLQYILGHTTFCDIPIKVNENVLIPRPETEEMVYRIIERTDDSPAKILDLGTGSGCIALALKKHFQNAEVTGFEFSKPALEVALENGRHNDLDVKWIHGDMLDPGALKQFSEYNLVASNPPYVLTSEKKMMERNVLDFEPPGALYVENSDPLKYFRAIALFAIEMLAEGGTLWVEINERFGEETAHLLAEAGFRSTTIHRDIHEKERFIQAGK